jgi:hypothetical protein
MLDVQLCTTLSVGNFTHLNTSYTSISIVWTLRPISIWTHYNKNRIIKYHTTPRQLRFTCTKSKHFQIFYIYLKNMLIGCNIFTVKTCITLNISQIHICTDNPYFTRLFLTYWLRNFCRQYLSHNMTYRANMNPNW